jgi:hypothetical protein
MLSRKKEVIEIAYGMLRSTMDITRNYLSAEDGVPLESKLKEFDIFVDELYIIYCSARKLSSKKHQILKAGREDPPPTIS